MKVLQVILLGICLSYPFGAAYSSKYFQESSTELSTRERFRDELRKRLNWNDTPASVQNVLVEVLKLLAGDMFPTAFSENASEQCKIDSIFYLESHFRVQLTTNYDGCRWNF